MGVTHIMGAIDPYLTTWSIYQIVSQYLFQTIPLQLTLNINCQIGDQYTVHKTTLQVVQPSSIAVQVTQRFKIYRILQTIFICFKISDY